jgi:Fic family protein
MAAAYVHKWKPIEPPSVPRDLEVPELRAVQRMWAGQADRLKKSGAYAVFWERLVRRWSIETGIIERVYDLSLGATELLVQHGFNANLIHHGDSDTEPERLIRILEDHRAGMSMVMDLIGGKRELTVGWIKELHVLLCRRQESVIAREVGPLGRLIEIGFEHGVYKRLPNNPTLEAGVHEYCPPEQVASEMELLVDIYRRLPPDLPEVRAAWLHHAFTQIHPFQDGNGRVARALASIDFIRGGLFPLVVDRTQRDSEYMPALREADAGRLQPLVTLFAECQEQAILRAVSEADIALEELGTLKSVLEAARDKVDRRHRADVEKRKAMAARIDGFATSARDAFKKVASEVMKSVPGVKARTERSTIDNEHYWRRQIIELARTRKYFADLREPRFWARLQIEDGGLTDLVVVIHFVGNPSPGSCAVAAFLVHRDRVSPGATEASSASEAETVFLPGASMLLASEEPESAQRRRFERWLNQAVVVGLAEWKRRL